MPIKEGPVQHWNHSRLGQTMQRYQVLYPLGSGSFGQVVAAQDDQGREVAIKKLRTWEIRDWFRTEDDFIPGEVACLQILEGVAGIPQLLDHFKEGEFYYIVMERPAEAVDLQVLIAENGAITEEAANEIYSQLLSILWNVRDAGIVHRDVKLENVLVNPRTLDTYLVDFGLATPIRDEPFRSFRGTMQYAPPEWLRKEEYFGDEAEAWTLGVLLYAMVTGTHLFVTVAEVLLKNIDIPKDLSRNLQRLLRQILNRNPMGRITLDQMMVSPWMREYCN